MHRQVLATLRSVSQDYFTILGDAFGWESKQPCMALGCQFKVVYFQLRSLELFEENRIADFVPVLFQNLKCVEQFFCLFGFCHGTHTAGYATSVATPKI